MKRLQQLKAKLKLKQAEAIIRIRNYSAAQRAMEKNIREIIDVKERIKYETAKLARIKQPVVTND